VVPITRICNQSMMKLFLFGGLALFAAYPAMAASRDDNAEMQRYVTARLAEMDSRGDDALKGYLELFKTNSNSSAVTDRLLVNAIRIGDMPSVVTAVRTQELRNQADGTAPMLLYADAFRKKDWSAAKIAIAELQAKSNYAFVAPLLTSWINVGQRKAPDLKPIDASSQQLLNYYAVDQRVYFALASGDINSAKEMLPALVNSDTDFARDLIIRAAPVLSAQGETVFSANALSNFVERSYVPGLTKRAQSKAAAILRPEEGLATLYTRLAGSLLEQKVPEQALILSRIANWLDPASDPAKLTLARALQDNGQSNSSRTILSGIPATSPYWPRAVADEVRMLAASNRPAEALQLASLAQKLHPGSANLILLAAQMQENAGDSKAASVTYAKIVSDGRTQNIAPRQKALYLLFLATAQDKSGQWQLAQKNLEEANALDSDNAYILNYLGYALLERNEQFDTALGYVKQAYQLAPQSSAIADSLGWGYYLGGKYDLALPLIEKAARQSGNDLAINEHLGDVYWQLNRRVDARYAWKIAAQRAEGKDNDRLQQKIDFGLRKSSQKS
jgi:tetratricopeptide (TPR) repeat protein